MNWFKISKDFSKRNIINGKIKYLKGLKNTLAIVSKLIFQSGKNAKATNYKIISSSKITSYPVLHDILIEADSLALDSPWKFSALCNEGIKKINNLIFNLTKEREEFIDSKKKNRFMKGWI